MSPKQLSRWCLLGVVFLCPVFMNFYGCGISLGVVGPPPPGGFTVQIVDENCNGTTTIHPRGTISGSWSSDLTGAVGATKSFPSSTNPYLVSGGRAPANWGGMWNPLDSNCLDPFIFPNGTGWSSPVDLHQTVTVGGCFTSPFSGTFGLTNPNPGTLTITGSGLSGNGGLPTLNLFDASLNPSGQVTALSVASDGTSATFPFPKGSNGSSLPFGHYSFNVINPGATTAAGIGMLSLATNDTSKASPFGVDAVDITNIYTQCPIFGGSCTTNNSSGPNPVATYSTTGQACFGPNYCTQVGSTPVAIKAYGVTTVTASGTFTIFGIPQFNWTSTTTGPQYAMVANYGSNTVSRINLLSIYTDGTLPVVNTITVGSQPVALALSPDQSKLYVANYGSGTVSEINLNTQALTRTVSVGTSPLSLAVDPGGASLWVGGLNYIAKVDLAAFGVTSTLSAGGQVGSLAVSAGQNSLVYSAVSSSQSLYQAQSTSTTTGATLGTYVSTSTAGTPYSSSSPGYQLTSVSMVSGNFNNRYAVTSTPSGFALVDLQTQSIMMSGSAPSAIRGMAIAPSGQMIYLTAPESNSLISVPGPPTTTP